LAAIEARSKSLEPGRQVATVDGRQVVAQDPGDQGGQAGAGLHGERGSTGQQGDKG
jgi:hypothetical protein